MSSRYRYGTYSLSRWGVVCAYGPSASRVQLDIFDGVQKHLYNPKQSFINIMRKLPMRLSSS